MAQIQTLAFPLLFILGLALFNSIIFKKKFEYVLPFALMESVLITYIFGFINLKIGFVISILFSTAAIPLLIYFLYKKKYSIKQMYITNLFWVFLIIYIIVFILNIDKSFLRWDEFSHWGMMVKELLRLDRYYYFDESVLQFHKQYPPFTTIIEYMWCQLCGGYKERHLYNAKIIFSLSLMFPVYAWLIDRYVVFKSNFSKWSYILLSTGIILLLPIVVDVGESALYRTIYTEYVIILLFFCGVFSLLYSEDSKNWFLLSNTILLTAILLVKQIGAIFYVGLILLYCCKIVIKKRYRKSVLNLAFFMVIPGACWGWWNYIAKKVSASGGQFAFSKFSVQNILNVFRGNGEAYQYTTIANYVEALFKRDIVVKPIGITYAGILILVLVIFLLCHCLETEKGYKVNLLIWGGCSAFSLFPYAVMMFVLYLFGFSQKESIELACYDRYMGTLICPLLMMMMIILMGILCRKYKNQINIICFASICFLVIVIIPNKTLQEEFTPGIAGYDVQTIFEGDANIIMGNTPENAKILLVNIDDNDSIRNIVAYQCHPRLVIRSCINKKISSKELRERCQECDYLYLSKINETFELTYSDLFEYEGEIRNQQLYKLEIKDNTELIRLDRVY